jgi:hypothetical protein
MPLEGYRSFVALSRKDRGTVLTEHYLRDDMSTLCGRPLSNLHKAEEQLTELLECRACTRRISGHKPGSPTRIAKLNYRDL